MKNSKTQPKPSPELNVLAMQGDENMPREGMRVWWSRTAVSEKGPGFSVAIGFGKLLDWEGSDGSSGFRQRFLVLDEKSGEKIWADLAKAA